MIITPQPVEPDTIELVNVVIYDSGEVFDVTIAA